MTLRQVLASMSENKGIQATIVDDEQAELLTFNIEGYASVERDILDKIVSKISLNRTATTITVKLFLAAPVVDDNTQTQGD